MNSAILYELNIRPEIRKREKSHFLVKERIESDINISIEKKKIN